MKSKNLFIVLLSILTLVGLFFWGYSRSATSAGANQLPNKESNGALIATEVFHNFGSISMKDGLVTKDFVINNPTDNPVIVTNLSTSCMCTTAFLVGPNGQAKGPFGMPGHNLASPISETIGAGEERVIRVVYDPNAHGPAGIGPTTRFITISDASGKSLELEIKALVTP